MHTVKVTKIKIRSAWEGDCQDCSFLVSVPLGTTNAEARCREESDFHAKRAKTKGGRK